MKNFIEIIGQLLFDNGFSDESSEATSEMNNALNHIQEAYAIVTWPDVQELMDEEWFDKEAVLDVDCKFGGSAYFIPLKRLIK